MSALLRTGTRESSDERNLVERVVRGDEDAARTFLDLYRGLFFHTITSFEANRSRRDDCFQNLALHSFELIRRGRYIADKGPFGPWLHRVLWCRAIDVVRKKEAKRQVRLVMAGESPPEREDGDVDPSVLLAKEEYLREVNRVFAALEPIEREVLWLRLVDGATHEEVAETLGLTLDQAKYRLKKSLEVFRRAVIDRLGDPPE